MADITEQDRAAAQELYKYVSGLFAMPVNQEGVERKFAQALATARAEGWRQGRDAAANVAGTMAERPYDNEPEFSAVCDVEAAIRRLKEPT